MDKFHSKKHHAPVSLKINGLILSESFQKCKIYAEKLWKYQGRSFLAPSVKGFLEVDWLGYLDGLRKSVGGQTWAVRKGVVVFVDGVFIGGEDELLSRFNSVYMFKVPGADALKTAALKDYTALLDRENLLYVYFHIAVEGDFIGTMLFQLRSDLLPTTSSWFALHCDPSNDMGYCYKGTRIHRICESGWFQAGRSDSYQSSFLEDESLCYKHDRRGILSFANNGKGTNKTEFFVTFKPSAWMDQYYVAFGRLVEGSGVLSRIENMKCTYESPNRVITIENCGVAQVGMAKRLPTLKRMKGLTTGRPNLHPDTFMDLIFDQFCQVLFDRLDAEVKRKFHQEWIGEMIWDRVYQNLCMKGPPSDVFDLNDRSSKGYFLDRYFAGLYAERDIPDHYIMKVLETLVENAVERSDVNKIAEHIVDLILDRAKSMAKSIKEAMAEDLVEHLFEQVYKTIFGEYTPSEGSQVGMISKSLSNVLSVMEDVERIPSDVQTEISPKRVSSTKTIVVEYILKSLLTFLETGG